MSHQKKLCNEDLVNKKNLTSIVNDGRFRVAIFGSARIKPEDFLYQEVSELAKRITKSGYDIITGGGPGAMEAASYGHQLAVHGDDVGKSIGINIQLPFEQHPNKYLDFTETASTFSSRLDTFMLLSHVFVITPGGIGTLLELFYTWQLMQVGHICRTPIILWGEQYKPLMSYINDELVKRGFVNAHEAELAVQVDTLEKAVELIHMAHSAYEKSGKEACINIKQYIAGAKELGLI